MSRVAGRRPAEQVGIAEVGVKDVGADLGEMLPHAQPVAAPEQAGRRNVDRYDPCASQALGGAARCAEVSDGDLDAGVPSPGREVRQQGFGASPGERVDQDVYAEPTVSHGSPARDRPREAAGR